MAKTSGVDIVVRGVVDWSVVAWPLMYKGKAGANEKPKVVKKRRG
jgi:hypothetical protein